jgi:hypothetical protein
MTDPRALKPCGFRAARPRAGRLGLSARCCRLFGLQRRKTAAFPASRARCLRLAPWDPRWTDFSGTVPFSHFSGSRTYPPLWDLTDANAVGRSERIDRPFPWRAAGAPGPHGLGRREDGTCHPPRPPHQPDRMSPAPVPKAAGRISATAPPAVPAFRAPSSAPSWDGAICQYIPIGILSRRHLACTRNLESAHRNPALDWRAAWAVAALPHRAR